MSDRRASAGGPHDHASSAQVEDKGFQEKEVVVKNMPEDLNYVIVHVRNATCMGPGDAVLKTFLPDPFVVIQLDG